MAPVQMMMTTQGTQAKLRDKTVAHTLICKPGIGSKRCVTSRDTQ